MLASAHQDPIARRAALPGPERMRAILAALSQCGGSAMAWRLAVLVAVTLACGVALAGMPQRAVAQGQCPSGVTLVVRPPDAAAPTTVVASITPPLGPLPISASERTHVHYFVDVPATPPGAVIPAANPRIIHTEALRQDLGLLTAGAHSITVVLGTGEHVACEARGSASFIVGQAQGAPKAPQTGNAGLAGSGATALTVVLLIGVAVAVVIAARLWTTRGGGGPS
jgi:hypothetical protein